MNTSGVIVLPTRGRYAACRSQVAHMEGVEVAIDDLEDERMVALLETETVEEQKDLLRRIQGLADVLLAELICHHFGEHESVPMETSPEPIEPDETSPNVPPVGFTRSGDGCRCAHRSDRPSAWEGTP